MEASEAQMRQDSEALRNILAGCLGTNTVKASEQELMRASSHPLFITHLCYLIPHADRNLLSLVVTTLKNYVQARYNSPENPVPPQQKEFLRTHIFTLFYQLYPEPAPTKLFKQIMHFIILVDYPWPGVADLIEADLQGSIVAAVYFFRQVAKANEYTLEQAERKLFEDFILRYFPRLESIVEKIFENYNERTAELLYEALKTFYSAFHIQVPLYLRNFAAFDRWLLFVQTILKAPHDAISASSQLLAARIYLKFFSLYSNEAQDGKQFKGWAAQFRSRYCERVFQHVLNLIGERKGGEDMQSTLVNCLYEVVKWPVLRVLFTSQHCDVLLYGNTLLPLCQSTPQELTIFRDEPNQYVLRSEDLSCAPLRRAILDLMENVADALSFGGKSEMLRMVQYSAGVLQSSASDPEKQVVIRVLSTIGKQVLKNKFLKSEFQNLTVRFFIPLLATNNPLIAALTLELLSKYLPFGQLDNETVNRLMELVYQRITNEQYLVVRYFAILAFTALLSHRAALEAATPHFGRILEIYVSMLNSIEDENLISCLEAIVKHFSNEVVAYAPELISHLIRLFVSLCKEKEQTDDEDEPDGMTPATAALSTITQLLDCSLSPEVYLRVSEEITDLFRGSFSTYSRNFENILSLFTVLAHRAATIADFNYLYVACRKLLEGDNSLLPLAQLPQQIAVELSTVEQADSEFEEDILSILKNLIQKMPIELLRRYPYPSHPQLLLALIENKRLIPEEAASLAFLNIDEIWRPYVLAYLHALYGIITLTEEEFAALTDPARLHPIAGLSLFPWLQRPLSPHLVRLIVNAYEAEKEEEEDIEDEENTAQLLQKYANEDDDDEEDYDEGQGISYSYHYDSPFNSANDTQNLVHALKSLSQADALAFSNSLSNKYRKKLEALFV